MLSNNFFRSILSYISIICLLGLLGACNPEELNNLSSKTLSGSVGDGPITQAQISVTDTNGTILGIAFSDSTANYSVNISAGNIYPILISANGGTDVVTNAAPDFTMVSVAIDSTVQTVNINPFSTLIVKTAQIMPGGLSASNVSIATQYIVDHLNFGLDKTLIPDPITTEITEINVAAIIKASEVLAETIRRTRSELFVAGVDITEDDVIQSVAADMTDGVMDGVGVAEGVNARVAATANVVSAQVLVEALRNRINVYGADATIAMDSAITLSIPTATMTTADIVVSNTMLTHTQRTVAATQALSKNANLSAMALVLANLSIGSLAADVDSVLPLNTSTTFNKVLLQLPSSTDNELESINSVIRKGDSNGGGTSATIRINAGGSDYVDIAGNIWSADNSYNTGTVYVSSLPIIGTGDDILFQSSRWDPVQGDELQYNLTVPNGNYIVNLYFSDDFGAAGLRTFDVQIAGNTVLRGFDIFNEAGGDVGLAKSFLVNVADSQLNIGFLHGDQNNPKISAIEILEEAAAPNTTTPVPTPTPIPVSNAPTPPTPAPPTPTPAPTPAPPAPAPAPAPPTAGSAPVVTQSYVPTNEIFRNPERGFHSSSNLLVTRNFNDHVQRGQTLTRSYIRLDDYRSSAIPASVITRLEQGLQALRNSDGIKVILRFTYNFSKAADAPKSRILQHIDQLTPTLQEYADVIYVLQAGFIGAWGEWHSSTNGLTNPTDEKDIMNALLQALPDSRMIQVRYPRKKQVHYQVLNENEAFSGSAAARIGHVNDCFLWNGSDGGTYGSATGYPSQSAEATKNYLSQDNLYVVQGGETCGTGGTDRRLDGPVEVKRMRWSYLNELYYTPILNSWKANGDFAEMQRKLGYRFRINDSDIPREIKPGGNFDFRVSIYNEGYANLYNPRSVYVVLDNGVDRYQVKLKQVDPRRWMVGQNLSFSTKLEIPANIANGNYTLALWLPDDSPNLQSKPSFSIRLANSGIWNASNGYNELGVVSVTNNAPGTQNSSATQLSEI